MVSAAVTPAVNPKIGNQYVIRNVNSGKCLNVYGNGSANGTNVTVYQKDGTTGQLWKYLLPTTNGAEFAPACAPNSRLNVYGSIAKNGSNVTIWSRSGNPTQGWLFKKVNNGYVLCSLSNHDYALTASGLTNSSNVYLSTYNSTNILSSQIWIFQNP